MAKYAEKDRRLDLRATVFTFLGEGELVCKLEDLDERMRDWFALRGIADTVGDSYNKATSAAEAKLEATAKWDACKRGDVSTASVGIWVAAIARVQGVEPGDIAPIWAKMDEAKRKRIRSNENVQLAKAEIELERKRSAAKGVDAGDFDLDLI